MDLERFSLLYRTKYIEARLPRHCFDMFTMLPCYHEDSITVRLVQRGIIVAVVKESGWWGLTAEKVKSPAVPLLYRLTAAISADDGQKKRQPTVEGRQYRAKTLPMSLTTEAWESLDHRQLDVGKENTTKRWRLSCSA